MPTILDTPAISRVRRNHGLEHATIHLLSRRYPGRRMAGHSDAGGFWLFGEMETEIVEQCVNEALTRLRNGERKLAVHPQCGTNFVTSGLAAGAAASLAMIGVGRRFRDKLERIPLAGLFATIALIWAQPLGFALQERVTTSGIPGDLEVVSIERRDRPSLIAHRIVTRG